MVLLPCCNGVPRLRTVCGHVGSPLRSPLLICIVDGSGRIFELLRGVRTAALMEVMKAKVDPQDLIESHTTARTISRIKNDDHFE